MYHIVVAIDDDRTQAQQLAATVERLAVEANLKVTLVHVFRNLDVPPQVSIHQILDDYEEKIKEKRDIPVSVQETVKRLGGIDSDLNLQIETGNPAEEIVRLTKELNADAVYIGGRKRSPVGKVMFGSVTQDVIFSTNVPVTISGSADE